MTRLSGHSRIDVQKDTLKKESKDTQKDVPKDALEEVRKDRDKKAIRAIYIIPLIRL
jgi:hypothetical protein